MRHAASREQLVFSMGRGGSGVFVCVKFCQFYGLVGPMSGAGAEAGMWRWHALRRCYVSCLTSRPCHSHTKAALTSDLLGQCVWRGMPSDSHLYRGRGGPHINCSYRRRHLINAWTIQRAILHAGTTLACQCVVNTSVVEVDNALSKYTVTEHGSSDSWACTALQPNNKIMFMSCLTSISTSNKSSYAHGCMAACRLTYV